MPPTTPIRFRRPGEVWPSGQSKVVALIAVSDTWVTDAFGAPLIAGFEPGMGPWVGVGGKLPSGAMVELVRYEHDNEGLFEVRFDDDSDGRLSLDEFMRATNLDRHTLRWTRPEEKKQE